MQPFLQSTDQGLQLSSTYKVELHLLILVILVVIATIIDVRERRIPNWLVGTGMAVGIGFHGLVSQGTGMAYALSGLTVGIVTLFPLFALGMMGAGDVKLVGMIGAFLGVTGVLGTVLATMAAGGVLALCISASKRMLPQLFANLRLILVQRQIRQMIGVETGDMAGPTSVGKMPYAVAILAGTLIQLFVLRY